MKTYNKLRLKALIIDIVVIIALWMVFFSIILIFKKSTIYDSKIGLSLLLSLFLCKDNINGQSIGKRIFNLKTVDYNGKSLNAIKLIARNFFVFLTPIEFVLLLYYDRRIGDRIINSKVVLVKESDKITIVSILIYLLTLFITTVIFIPLV